MFFLRKVSGVAVLQYRKPEILVKPFRIIDVMYVVEVDTKRVVVIQITNIHHDSLRPLFTILDVLRSVSIVSACMLLCAATDVVEPAENTRSSIYDVSG